MVQINLTEVLKGAPKNEWLALSHNEDRIVASAVRMEDAVAAAKARGENNPIMMKVPPDGLLVL